MHFTKEHQFFVEFSIRERLYFEKWSWNTTVKGFTRNKKFHPITPKKKSKTRKQIGIVTGGLASGTKAVAGSAFKGTGTVAKRGLISAGKTAIGTPAKEGLGKRILVGTGKGIGKGISIGAKGAGRRIKESAINRLKNSIRGKQLDGQVIEELINQRVTDPDRITRNVFPPQRSLVQLQPQQQSIVLQISSISAGGS